jgi:hypothetical protein
MAFGFSLGYLTFLGLDEISKNKEEMNDVHHIDMSHLHPQREVSLEIAPELSVKVIADSKSGYNIQILTRNYKWSPEAVNTKVIENEGHAHIYINDEKIARVYGEWFHLDDHHLSQNQNLLRVTLNANDHSEWSINNQVIEVTQILN